MRERLCLFVMVVAIHRSPFLPLPFLRLQVQAFFQEICAAYAGRRPDGRKNILSFGDR